MEKTSLDPELKCVNPLRAKCRGLEGETGSLPTQAVGGPFLSG